jgi:hypothetical protein
MTIQIKVIHLLLCICLVNQVPGAGGAGEMLPGTAAAAAAAAAAVGNKAIQLSATYQLCADRQRARCYMSERSR